MFYFMLNFRKERDDHNASYVGSYGDVESDVKPMSADEMDGQSSLSTTDEGRGSLERRSPLAGGSKKASGGKWRKDKQQIKPHSAQKTDVKDVEEKLMV